VRLIRRSFKPEHYGGAAIISLSSVLALSHLGQRWGDNLLPTKASMGVAGMQLVLGGVPATFCSKRPDASQGPGQAGGGI
jgi:hypothetical protein